MQKSIWCYLNMHEYDIDISYKFANFKHYTIRTKTCKNCIKKLINQKVSNFGILI